jgi:hypothetical protein
MVVGWHHWKFFAFRQKPVHNSLTMLIIIPKIKVCQPEDTVMAKRFQGGEPTYFSVRRHQIKVPLPAFVACPLPGSFGIHPMAHQIHALVRQQVIASQQAAKTVHHRRPWPPAFSDN